VGPATYDANFSAIKDRKDFNAHLPLEGIKPIRELSHHQSTSWEEKQM
jgi:hypothetical protein